MVVCLVSMTLLPGAIATFYQLSLAGGRTKVAAGDLLQDYKVWLHDRLLIVYQCTSLPFPSTLAASFSSSLAWPGHSFPFHLNLSVFSFCTSAPIHSRRIDPRPYTAFLFARSLPPGPADAAVG
jgi:hypothetical protein